MQLRDVIYVTILLLVILIVACIGLTSITVAGPGKMGTASVDVFHILIRGLSGQSLIKTIVRFFKNITYNVTVDTCSRLVLAYADLPTCGINYTALRAVKYVGHYVYFNMTCNGTLLDTLLGILSLNSTMITPTAYLATLYMFSPIALGVEVRKCVTLNYTSTLFFFKNITRDLAISWKVPSNISFRLLTLSDVPYPPSLIVNGVSYGFNRTLEEYVNKTVSNGEVCCSCCCASYSKSVTTIVRLRLFKICFRYRVINGSNHLTVVAIARVDGKTVIKKSSRRRGTLCISIPLLDNESHSISLVAYVNDTIRVGNFTIRRIPYYGLLLKLSLIPVEKCNYTYGTVSCASGNNTCTFTVVTDVTCHYEVKIEKKINIIKPPDWVYKPPSQVPQDIVNGTLLLATLFDLYRSVYANLSNISMSVKLLLYLFDIDSMLLDSSRRNVTCVSKLLLKMSRNGTLCVSDASLLIYAAASLIYPTCGLHLRNRIVTVIEASNSSIRSLLEVGYNATVIDNGSRVLVALDPGLEGLNKTVPVELYYYGKKIVEKALSCGFKKRMLFTTYLQVYTCRKPRLARPK
ncbi:MAG: hypothetical protein GXO26_04585 [Crenarchaeota archaeon]|nr:hypothetical protein [Thermoproteota archaeon]